MYFPHWDQRMIGHRRRIRNRNPMCTARLEIKIELVAGISPAHRVTKFGGIHLDANRQWWRVRRRMVVHLERFWGNAQNRTIEPLLAWRPVGGASPLPSFVALVLSLCFKIRQPALALDRSAEPKF